MSDEIKQIYRIWQNRYNMMVLADEYEFSWIGKSNPTKDQVFTYVYKSGDGTPKGYVTLKQAVEADGRNIACSRFFAVDAEGIKGLLNLLISLGSDHDYASFDLPADIDMSLILPEWAGHANKSSHFAGMVRVINVQKGLENARYQGSGTVTISVTDRQIPENSGTYKIEFKDGMATGVTRRLLSVQAADVEMDINAFSRLIIGTCDVSSLAFMDHVKVNTRAEALTGIFYRKPNYITEYF